MIPVKLVIIRTGIGKERHGLTIDLQSRCAVFGHDLGDGLLVFHLIHQLKADELAVGDILIGNGNIGVIPLQSIPSAFKIGRHHHAELHRELTSDGPLCHVRLGHRHQRCRRCLINGIAHPYRRLKRYG